MKHSFCVVHRVALITERRIMLSKIPVLFSTSFICASFLERKEYKKDDKEND